MTAKSVLIVDDDLDQHVLAEMYLGHAGYQVLHANDGREGYEAARDRRPTLILMDMRMPAVDGEQAFRLLRGDERTSARPWSL